MYKKPEAYKQDRHLYQVPNHDIDPKKKKEKDFYKCMAESLMSDWACGHTIYPMEYYEKRTLKELQDFARGRQNMDNVKRSLLGMKAKSEKGWATKMNVSWEGYDKLPQLFDVMRATNIPLDYSPDLYCIDENSAKAVEWTRQAMRFILDAETKKFMEQASFSPDIEVNPEELGLQTKADVDTYIDAGGFQLQWQIAAQALISKSKMESDYKEFQDLSFDNLITNPDGFTGARTYIEKSTGIPKFRSLDMDRVICPYFRGYSSKGKIMRAGEVREMTIGDIRRENPSLTEAELRKIAKDFAWMNEDYVHRLGQNGFFGGTNIGGRTEYGVDPINSVKVLVLDFQFLSGDIESYIKNEKRGFFKETDNDKKLSPKSVKYGDEIIRKRVIKKHEAQWVIGTDCFLNYGQVEDTVYYGPDGNKTPELDFFFVKINNKSLVERCVALVNDMNMILMKYRNTWATLPAAPSLAIQRNLVENVFLQGKKQQPEDLFKILQELGVLYYDALDDFGKPLYMAGGQKPIEFLNTSPIVSMLQACSNELLVKVNEIKEVLGMQGGVDGGQRSQYQGLGETQLYFQAANNSLAPTFNAYHYLLRDVWIDILKKGQIVAKTKNVKLSYSILGSKNMKMLELTDDFTNADFNVEVRPSASNEEKVALLTEINNLKILHGNSDGAQGITHAQYLFLYDKVMTGNFKQAYFVLSKIDAKRRQEALAQKQQDQEYNIISNQEAAKTKAAETLNNEKAKGYIQAKTTTIDKLLSQNNELLKLRYAPRSEGEQGVDINSIDERINANNESIMRILSETNPDNQMPAQQEPQQQIPQQMPYQEDVIMGADMM